jgi:hypothetical protein
LIAFADIGGYHLATDDVVRNDRRGYLPFTLGVASAAVVLVGKFTFESDPAMYAGLAVLIGASVWNTWPRRASAAGCAACVGEQHSNP